MTPLQNSIDTDALTELFNIGLHRAAASLSELTNRRVGVDLPRLWVCPVQDLKGMLHDVIDGDLATVHQIFGGAVTGNAVLLLEYEKAAELAKVMTEGQVAAAGQIDHSAREVLAEIGNIVLGACLSAFGNVLKVSVTFSVPRMHVESLDALIRSLQVDHAEVQYAMVATTHFQLKETEIGGFLIVVIGLSSLQLISDVMRKEVE